MDQLIVCRSAGAVCIQTRKRIKPDETPRRLAALAPGTMGAYLGIYRVHA